MKLYLMRHAQTDEGETMDASRGLNDIGTEQCKAMRRFRKALGIKWDVVFSSNFERAEQTALGIANNSAVYFQLPALQPGGNAPEAFAAMAKEFDIVDDTRVLVVTHHPLIEQMAATVCFSFDPDHNAFSHCTMLRVDTHKIPADKHPLHWLVRPSLVEGLEEADLVEAGLALAESLRDTAKARVVDPLIAKLKKALARRFRSQARQYKATSNFSRPDLAFDGQAPYSAGAAMVHAQIGKLEEADKKPTIPLWLSASLIGAKRTANDIERDIDGTSASEIADLVAAGESQDSIARTIATWAKDRAETIAVTEISTAYHQGASDAAKLIGDREGVLVQKAWNVEDDPCDECLGNLDDGWVDEDILFASGDDAPPAHPNCRCSLSYRTSGEDEA